MICINCLHYKIYDNDENEPVGRCLAIGRDIYIDEDPDDFCQMKCDNV